jgi:DNA (cytosine-5)-methyltransferase 1
MRYFSVCSGIEAASVAWHDLGWTPLGFSEIEPFPCELLKQRFPGVKNYGDLNRWKEWDIEPGTVDVLVGGPPCQAFSVAGLREGMADPRGNLSLQYFGLVKRLRPKWIVYENVPGLLSARSGSDFSSLISALAECGYGFAWRMLDAQHFNLAQRRQRVFIVGCRTGDWRHPAAVLFDGPSSYGNFKKSEEAAEKNATASGAGAGSTGKQVPFGTRTNPDIANCLETTCHDYSRADGFNMVLDGRKELPIAFKVRGGGEYSGTKGGEIKPNERGGTGMLHYEDKTFTVAATQDQFVATPQAEVKAVAFQPGNLARRAGSDPSTEVFPTLSKDSGDQNPHVAVPMAVRRLLPSECEALQGFPKDWTKISWRGKPADQCPDGPRYKAIGNSMATNCMKWIGRRIQMVDELVATLPTQG